MPDHPEPIVIRPDYTLGQRVPGFLMLAFAPLPLASVVFPGGPVEGGLFIALILAVFLGGFGLRIVGKRTGVAVDLARGELVTVHGYFKAKERRSDLALFEEVTVSHEERTTNTSNNTRRTYDVYPVRLTSRAEVIGLCEHRARQPAMEAAELYARLLEKRLVDLTSGQRVAREAGALDDSLQDRLRQSTAPAADTPSPGPAAASPPDTEDVEGHAAFGALPPKMQEAMEIGVEPTVYRDGEDVVIEIPPMGLRKNHLGPSMVIFAVFGLPGLLACFFMPQLSCGLISFGAIGAALVPFKWMEQILKRQRVRLTPEALLVEARGRKVRLPYDRLQTLHIAGMSGPKGHMTLVGGGVIVADAGGELVTFGDALPRYGLIELLRTIRGYIADREAVLARIP